MGGVVIGIFGGNPVSSPKLRLLAVHAHPDDESSKGAATAAKYAAEGVEVTVALLTGGEAGDILNPHFAKDKYDGVPIVEIRREEMAAAAAALGVNHVWLGYVDSGLPQGEPVPPVPPGRFSTVDTAGPIRDLVKLIRELKPQVMTTYDEDGGYPHPDHIRTHEVSVAAYHAAADPDYHPELGAPWEVLKVYYNQDFEPEKLRTLHLALQERGLVSPFADWLDTRANEEVPQREITTRVRCAEYFSHREAALRSHASQVDPDGFFFAVPIDIAAEVWPYESFELGLSRVPVQLPEDDLFAGIRQPSAEH